MERRILKDKCICNTCFFVSLFFSSGISINQSTDKSLFFLNGLKFEKKKK